MFEHVLQNGSVTITAMWTQSMTWNNSQKVPVLTIAQALLLSNPYQFPAQA
jgi:hypothetical protein